MEVSVVLCLTETASTLAAAASMPWPLRLSFLIRLLYLKTPQQSLVAPGPSVSV